jgi:succinate-semialdehyde dehydrogenase/glutarate-semialdehyde dehydrogenase
MLRRWYELVLENAEDLATLVTWENGKPLADARDEINYAASFLEWFSEEAPRVYGDTIPLMIAGQRIITVQEPVGICALITPWNFPVAMITREIGAALAAGCTVIVKAPAETPFTANTIVKLAQRAGYSKRSDQFCYRAQKYSSYLGSLNDPPLYSQICLHWLDKCWEALHGTGSIDNQEGLIGTLGELAVHCFRGRAGH